MKRKWLVADVTAVGSLDGAKRAILGMILAGRVFDEFRAYLWHLPTTLFSLNDLSKVIRAQEGVPTSQSGSPTTNTAQIGKKYAQPKPPPKTARSALSGNPTAGALVTNHSNFIK